MGACVDDCLDSFALVSVFAKREKRLVIHLPHSLRGSRQVSGHFLKILRKVAPVPESGNERHPVDPVTRGAERVKLVH